ncbi:MAG: sarcosine oxidase subunit alpha family protein [Woeseia sp.]
MTRRRRTGSGGQVDRRGAISFCFDKRRYQGLPGDTLASALLANGVTVVGRSVKYHRRRGIFSIGSEEPNALVRIGNDGQPNTRATMVPLIDGLEAWSQNRWPTLGFDVFAMLGALAPLLSTGFYYKTFMWPRRAWKAYEHVIRKVAGLGEPPVRADPDAYEHAFGHCDVMVVGCGPAGLSAARVAADAGADVWLVDESPWAGGWLNRERATIDSRTGSEWAAAEIAYLESLANVRVLLQTTAFGYYDHNLVALAQLPAAGSAGRQRLWRVRASRVILATGAIERPCVFAGNDLPGVMLAGAARAYVNQFGVRAGHRAVVFTNNDSAYRTAMDLHDAGVTVVAVVDCRTAADPGVEEEIRQRKIPILKEHVLVCAAGGSRLRHVRVRPAAGPAGRSSRLKCDLLAVSAGWSPAIHLHAQSGGASTYDEATASVIPADNRQATHLAGAVCGRFGLAHCLDDGARAGAAAAAKAGFSCQPPRAVARSRLPGDAGEVAPLWAVPDSASGTAFVDLQNDVTGGDVEQACLEGYESVEHLKRYTTLGMGTDQGKTSNINGLAILAGRRGRPIASIGTTTFRPPYTPVTMGAVAGPEVRERLEPVRRSPLHDVHAELAAEFDHNGLWLRPAYYPAAGESMRDAVERETRTVRTDCGIIDVSTLGKFEVQGPDAARFMERVYVNRLTRLASGRSRYGLMLREDGMIFDDGTVTRLDESRYFLTTSTSHAAHVHEQLDYFLEICCAGMEVAVTCVTEYWAAIAVAGPRAPAVLQAVGVDCSPRIEQLPFMAVTTGTVAGIPARLLRISFSGEWACEIYVPARQSTHVWNELRRHGALPYGLEAMDTLRIEKGFIGVGAEANGRTTPIDLGFARMTGKTERHIGQYGLQRVHRNAGNRLELVGLLADDPGAAMNQGAQLLATQGQRGFGSSIGHVSSAAYSPTLGRHVALALLAGGRSRTGDSVYVADPLRGSKRDLRASVCAPCFYDPDGTRLQP